MKSKYFPWALFKKFYISLVILINFVFVCTLGAASFVFDFQFYRRPTFLIAAGFFVLSLLVGALFAYRFALPLRRILHKALRLASKKQALEMLGQDSGREAESDELFDAEGGEYFELEQALEKIRRKLKKRRMELAHEREESQTLMSFLQDAVVSVGIDGHINYFNSRFATLFLNSEQVRLATGLSLMDLIRNADLNEAVLRSLRSGSVERLQLKTASQIDSLIHDFAVTVSALREEKGREIYGALVLFTDISDLKKAEKIRIEFVENASHELRTPLTSMKGFVEMAREDLEQGRPQMVPQFLATISKSVDRLNELVGDMLTLSSLEQAGGLRIETMDPQVVTAEVIERLVPLAEARGIVIKSSVLAPEFRADPGLVDRVLENLVGNAIKYIQEGGWVHIEWTQDLDSKCIRLAVKDNGPGISEEHLGRLFERFYRVDKGRSRDMGGTGLGLAIVKHIVHSHGGQIRVTSHPGQGAEFQCEFPVRSSSY